MQRLLSEIRACEICKPYLKNGVRPVLRADTAARIAVIGQAPGSKVHKSGIPWDDPSGIRLRDWLKVRPDQFYDEKTFAIIPMGFCYPGKGKSGDLPPRPECAPKWHRPLFDQLPNIELILLIGSYAQKYYLENGVYTTLTQTVKNYKDHLPQYLPLPHPSPRNNLWLRKNPWFEEDIIPILQERIEEITNR